MGRRYTTLSGRRWKGATIEDVASRAGVSVTTVSRVLNRSAHKVNANTQRLVLAAAHDLKYRPNAVARSLIQGQTATLGVLIPDLSNPYYASIVHGVEAAALEAGYAVLLCNTDRSLDKRAHYLRVLEEKRIEGMIVAGGAIASEEDGPLRDLNVPVVSVGHKVAKGFVIDVDNFGATNRLTRHLLELGHERIAVVAGPATSLTSQARLEGCRAALASGGQRREPEAVAHGTWRVDSGYQAALRLLRASSEFTAIIVANDLMALGALRALREHGIAVPEDISIAGHDDIPEASYMFPALTTMRIPSHELGRIATETLLRMIERGGSIARTVFSAELVQRESTAPAPSGRGAKRRHAHRDRSRSVSS